MKTNIEILDELLTRQEEKRLYSYGIKDPDTLVGICKQVFLDNTKNAFIQILKKGVVKDESKNS